MHVQQKKDFRQGYYEVWPLIEGDVVITFSPDGNSMPEKIPELVAKMRQGHDMVIASRYKDDATGEDDDIVPVDTRPLRVHQQVTDLLMTRHAQRLQPVARPVAPQSQTFSCVGIEGDTPPSQ